MNELNTFEIQFACREDVNEIVELENASFSSDAFSKKRFLYLISKANSEFIIVRKEHNLVAYLIILKRKNSIRYRIYSLAIAKEAQGKGLAKRLLNYAEQQAKKELKREISLEVSENNLSAINLYKSQSYQVIGVKENYYSDGNNALLMLKRLNF